MSDPDAVTTEQLRAAYEALGLDPERFHGTRTIHISPDGVEVVRYHQPDGKTRIVDGTNAVYAEVLTLRLFDWDEIERIRRPYDLIAAFGHPVKDDPDT